MRTGSLAPLQSGLLAHVRYDVKRIRSNNIGYVEQSSEIELKGSALDSADEGMRAFKLAGKLSLRDPRLLSQIAKVLTKNLGLWPA